MSNDNGGYPPPGQQPPAYAGAPVPPQQPAYPGAAPQPQQPPVPGYPGAAPQQPSAPVYPGTTPPAQAYPGAAPTAQGYPGASYAPSYGQPYPAPLKSNGLAITALICGIAGVLLFWLAYIVLPFLAAVTAVITGHMALGKIKRDPALGGKGIALTGVILGYVGVALNLIIGIGFLMLIVYGISQGANSGY